MDRSANSSMKKGLIGIALRPPDHRGRFQGVFVIGQDLVSTGHRVLAGHDMQIVLRY